jgi:hypothetical protein
MVRSNPKFRKGSKFDGMAKDDSHQTETFRGSSEAESFIGSTTSPTITRIAKDMERITKTVKSIANLSLEIEEIKNGAIVDPKTGIILKDDSGNTIFYKDSCKFKRDNHKLREQ